MSDDDRFEWPDKIAAVLLGTPLVCGVIVLALALGSPGSAPYRDRATTVPVSVGLIVVGVAGSGAYIRWRLRAKRSMQLEAMAATGALRLLPHQRTPVLIRVSHALADELLLPPGSCPIPSRPTPLTAGELSAAVHAAIRRLESDGRVPIDPFMVVVVASVVVDFARAGSGTLGAATDLNDAIPMFGRQRLRRSLRRRGVTLPRWSIPTWALTAVVFAALAVTFGTVVPLAQWLDRAHAIDAGDNVQMLFARIMVRGGFFGLLIVSVVLFALIARWMVPVFPPGCRTVGQLAAGVQRTSPRQSSDPVWDGGTVWEDVRHIVARQLRVDHSQVERSTPIA